MLGAVNTPDPVTRLNAALQGRCRIEREIGEGGMATVYLADDLKHQTTGVRHDSALPRFSAAGSLSPCCPWPTRRPIRKMGGRGPE